MFGLAIQLALGLPGGAGAHGPALDDRELAGRQIFLSGTSPSAASIGARVAVGPGLAGIEIKGASLACGNCHGEDGRGRAEGGIVPPDIRWSVLTRAWGHQHDNGRRHGPFDADLLRRALTQGIDPAGHVLDPVMPRYAMSAKDMAALQAYLERLESLHDPGLGDKVLRIGTLLPASGPANSSTSGLGASLHAVLSGYFDVLNQRGGLHGRRLELVSLTLPADPAQARVQLGRWLADEPVFALLAPFCAGVESTLAQAALAGQLPVIGPLGASGERSLLGQPRVFHLLPGVTELARVLASHAAAQLQLNDRPVLLWHADSAEGRAQAQDLATHMHQTGWSEVLSRALPPAGSSLHALAGELQGRGVATLLVLGAGADAAGLARAGAALGWTPHLLLPGPLARRDIVDLPAAFEHRVVLAYPSSPQEQSASVLRRIQALLPPQAGAPAHPAPLVWAYAAALLLVEGLQRSGRDLSRSTLVATLEGLQGFDTGLLPALSYNADRRIGALGAYLVGVDIDKRDLRPLGGYSLP